MKQAICLPMWANWIKVFLFIENTYLYWSHEVKNWIQRKLIYRLGTVQWQFTTSKMIYVFWNISFKYVFIVYLSITTDCCYCYWIQTDFGVCILYFIYNLSLYSAYFKNKQIISSDAPTFRGRYAGLSESFEVGGWVVKVSGQSRDILFKKHHL